MSYVIYNRDTTKMYPDYRKTYATERAAKAGLTRAVKAGKIDRTEYAISDISNFKKFIEKSVTRAYIHPHTGKECETTESVNMPYSCSPASEAYWCM